MRLDHCWAVRSKVKTKGVFVQSKVEVRMGNKPYLLRFSYGDEQKAHDSYK